MTVHRWLPVTLGLVLLESACGAPPVASAPPEHLAETSAPRRRADVPDDCATEPGQPPPEPLRVPYEGVAKAARCQRAVYTIMGGVTHFLGVECRHCHLEPDYAADTHNKQIANWMARELVPRLRKRTAERGAAGEPETWCQDCHAGKPKPLGDPRRRDFAIEWMTTHLVDEFETNDHKPPKCKDCHGGDLGSPEFRSKIILKELTPLPLPPAPAAPAAAPEPEPAAESQAAPPSAGTPAPSASALPAAPLPDFGKR